ncbi:MAG: hypothetical protein M5U09_08210 [Gammaproteobacteria bacterium]|nr:hypothetical protein [Gammaproteobacteria bacterium]
MWIELSKFLPYLVYPLTIVLLVLIVALLRSSRAGRGWIAFALVLLLAASNPYLAERFRLKLEGSYPAVPADEAPAADAIVMLGGALYLPLPPMVEAELSDAADRVLAASRLYRAGKAPRVVVTGGNVFDQW